MPTVTIIQRVLPHYRISFAERLHAALAERGIQLQLIYGREKPGTVPRTVVLDRPWTLQTRNAYWSLGSLELVWQPCLAAARASDVVIVEQSNRLLVNYLLMARRQFSRSQLAFWGHGRNMQSSEPRGWRERLKRTFSRRVDWWFAYTDMSRDTVLESGFPAERITVVNNAIDDEELRSALAACRDMPRETLVRELGCTSGNVALFCSGLHKDKCLEFLLSAARLIREQVADFELIVIGDGPERAFIENAARTHEWIHYVGAVTGAARARYFRAAKLLLMPGPVGLVMVDSFVGECPLVTTRIARHGPEIAYLRCGENGLMTAHEPRAYADVVAEHLLDDRRLLCLRQGCQSSASDYSIGSMVQNFVHGIEGCLQVRPT